MFTWSNTLCFASLVKTSDYQDPNGNINYIEDDKTESYGFAFDISNFYIEQSILQAKLAYLIVIGR